MKDGGFLVDSEDVRVLAGQLHDGVSGLDEVARQGPPAPNAGASSAKVADILASIMQSIAGLIASVENTVSKIHASDGSYGDVDNRAETDLRHAGGG
ncbi:MAG: hypothetical protein ACRDSP_07300 [Pseudonocardiaceae bacterium]